MKRAVSALLLLLAACRGPAPEPEPGARRAVLDAMLSQVAREVPEACVSSRMDPPLDLERHVIANAAAAAPIPDRPAAAAGPPAFGWSRADDSTHGPSLGSAASRELDRRLRAALAASPAVSGTRLEPALLSTAFHSGPICRAPNRVRLSEPAFAGNVAFMEMMVQCDDLCGGGEIVAFARHDAAWIPIASAVMWVS